MAMIAVDKPGNPVSYTVVVGNVAQVLILTAPNFTVVEIDEIELLDQSGANNQINLFDNFNRADTGGAVSNPKGTFLVAANAIVVLTDVDAFKVLNALYGQTTAGNMRVTFRGREL